MQLHNLFLTPLLLICALLPLMFGNAQAASQNNPFKDRLDVPARKIGGAIKVERQPILAVTMTKKGRVIGVGLRGLIALSDDRGATWRQASVPVQSDLTAVAFPTDHRGWAVGHDGVILTTSDAGETWIKQLDGLIAAPSMVEYYQRRVEAGEVSMQRYVDQTKVNVSVPGALPYLGVHFENEQVGYVVGSFGLIMRTQDGGKTWEPWLHHVDNEKVFNLNTIQQIGSTLYMVGERGIFWTFDKTKQRFNSRASGYEGTLYGIAGKDNILLVVGLAGTVLRSADSGVTWQKVAIDTSENLTAVASAGGTVLIVSQDGELFIGDSTWQTFRPLPVNPALKFASTVVADVGVSRIILAGYGGIRVIAMTSNPAVIK